MIKIKPLKVLTGKIYGRLVVVERNYNMNKGGVWWTCQCSCGNIKSVKGSNLINGGTKSCGCYKSECSSARIKAILTTHGGTGTRLHKIWECMKSRCSYSKGDAYKNYGGRGITVCDEWKNDFVKFYDWALVNGYKDDLTLDRINVNGNYEPSNCRWVTRKEQNRNTRKTIYLTFNNETKCLKDWSEFYGLPYHVLKYRYHKGWSIEKALATPLQIHKKKVNADGG